MNGFSLWLGVGASLGLWRVWRTAPRQQAEVWLDAGLITLAAALAGARLLYAATNWPYFQAQPLRILQLWQGGLIWQGAAAGAGLAWIWLAIKHRAAGITADRLYPLLPPLAVCAWIGCWQVGTWRGVEAPIDAWWGAAALGETLPSARYFPLQPLAALVLLLFFWVLETRLKPQPPGRLAGVAISVLLLHLLAASLMTSDAAPRWNDLRIDTWFALGYLGLLLSLVLANKVLSLIPGRRLAREPFIPK